MAFHQLSAFYKLRDLALKPLDLTEEGVLTQERVERLSAWDPQLQLKLFYATERVTEEVLQALEELAWETGVLGKMRKMQSGAIVNYIEGYSSEKRPALHTAMRDFGEKFKAQEASEKAWKELAKLADFMGEIEGDFSYAVQVGIGGSSLGPKAISHALEVYCKDKKIYFLSNVDPDERSAILREVELERTLFIVVSKSGSTLETAVNEAYIREYLKERRLDPAKQIVAVTCPGSPMDDPTRYRKSFYMWDYVGGRYSSTSMVGGVILAFAFGMEVWKEFLKGAYAMDQVALEPKVRANFPLLGALLGIWNRNFLGYASSAVIPYSKALDRFPAHIQQLDMESNGKRITQGGEEVAFATGPIIWGEPGTDSQHSFFQLLHQGTEVVPLEMIGFCENQYGEDTLYEGTTSQEKLLSNLFAQSISLAKGQKSSHPNKRFLGNRPSRVLLARRLDPYTMGALLAYYEHKVAFQGWIWGINSFDQEGVELGKKLALELMQECRLGKDEGLAATYVRQWRELGGRN